MRNKHVKNFKILSVLLISALCATAVTGCGKKVVDTTDVEYDESVPDYKAPEPTGIMATPFVSETEYLGGDTLKTPELFMYPFDEERYENEEDEPSSDYVSNKELLQSSAWDDTYYDNYVASITKFANLLYGNDYRQIWESEESFVLDYISFYPVDTVWSDYDDSMEYYDDEMDLTKGHSNAEEAKRWAEWYADYKVYGECDVEVDKCLVWETGGFHNVRCAFHVELHTSDEGIAKFNELLGLDGSEYVVGNKFTIVYEFQFAKENPEYFMEQSIWTILPEE